MKSKEELDALRAEIESVGKKVTELSEDELKEVTGGMKIVVDDMPEFLRPLFRMIFG